MARKTTSATDSLRTFWMEWSPVRNGQASDWKRTLICSVNASAADAETVLAGQMGSVRQMGYAVRLVAE